MALSLAWLCKDRSVPRGRYWRSNLLVFSFDPAWRGGSRIPKIDLDLGGQCQTLMIREFLASVPGQRPVKFAGQSLRLLDQCRDNAFGILVRNLDQHHVARMALDKRCDITIPRSTDQVALPMAWHGTIFNRRRSLANGHGILDLTESVSFHACLDRRTVRLALSCSRSSFLSTPRA